MGRSASARLVPMMALVALMIVSLWAPKSEARLDPYYLLRGLSAGSVKPRILFVLDTSGSMTWRSTSQNECTSLADCENTAATNRSRINIAREAVRTVVSTVGGIANFSLMTFGQVPPPDRNSQIPNACSSTCASYVYECYDYVNISSYSCKPSPHLCDVAWVWVDPPGASNAHYLCNSGSTAGEKCGDAATGNPYACNFDNFCSNTVVNERFHYEYDMNHAGWGIGAQYKARYYELCGTKRPFPYLRWDDLGYGAPSVTKVETGTVPGSPMADVTPHSSNTAAVTENEERHVQWFPKFMGVRANLNAGTDVSQDILLHTFGDFGTPNNGADNDPTNDTVSATQLAQVWGHDFYYWPYVDGFIGYGSWVDNDSDRIGIAQDQAGASLYAPFYLEGAQSQAVGTRGPSTLADGRQQVEWLTADQKGGGVDAVGGTPWTNVIGNNSTGTPNSDNSAFSHATVSSYLKMVTTLHPEDSCLPTAAILLTDGDPNCGSCFNLYTYIARLRRTLGVNVYAVGFTLSSTKLNRMACAGAGQFPNGSSNPCTGTPPGGWDTCRLGTSAGCSYSANNAAALAATLRGIVAGLVELDISSGTGASANESGVGAAGVAGEGEIKQTQIRASTKYPEWRGSVTRDYCDDTSQTYCQPGPFDFSEYDFQGTGTTSCGEDRQWDAAVCLLERDWDTRDIYMNTSANAVVPIWSGGAGGSSTAAFRSAITAEVVGGGSLSNTEKDEIAKFAMGFGWKDEYKLQGLANSAPSIIRRIPKHQPTFKPSVGIRDPHCAGRLLDFGEEVDGGLVTMSKNAWGTAGMNTATTPNHFEYQEAVTIGSDLGLIHFFQFNSGNELFAFLPRFHLQTVVDQWNHWKNGADVGQPDDLAAHSFGMAATANQGYVFDIAADKWRHVMVMGSGVGSKHYVALDVSHLTPFSTLPAGSPAPLEVLWTTQDTRASDPAWVNMQAQLGEGWARPAITFHDATTVQSKIQGRVVLSSGYPIGAVSGTKGRYMAVLDAVTGDVLDNFAVPTPPLPTAADGPYDAGYGQVSDVAVASYCTSRYWGEAQEAYVNDPAGRLFRVDLLDGLAHERDFGAAPSGANRLLTAAHTFSACQGLTRPCSISGAKGDAFVYSPAVAALDRIDTAPGDPIRENQLLIAMNSGSVYDDSTDGGDSTNDFNSSIYLMVDDHDGVGNERGGFSIPAGEPKTAAGTHAAFFRAALTDMQRTRVFTPYPGYTGAQLTDTGYFNKGTRPVGSPLIRVTRGEDSGGVVLEDIEFYYVEYTVYEPPSEACDVRFQDTSSGIWYPDAGSTYKIRLRLPVDTTGGFDFQNGAGSPFNGGGFSDAGLQMLAPEQDLSGACADGVCGAAGGTPSVAPCDPNDDPLSEQARSARGMGYSEIRGFSPFE